jgi:uncharacterized membrane protein
MRLLLVMVFLLCVTAVSARTFMGNASVEFIQPTPTTLVACTPNEKYTVEPGRNITVRLYVRNRMPEKTVGRVDLMIESEFNSTFVPESLGPIVPGEHEWFDMTFHAPADMPAGAYHVELLIGTDEYMVGSLTDSFQLRVLPHARFIPYISGVLVVMIAAGIVWRFLQFRRGNSKPKSRKRKTT